MFFPDNHKNTERCKRKLETSDIENCGKSCKKQSKNDRKGTAIKIQELNECSVKLKDVMCMDRLELLSGKSESATVTDSKHNNESIKLVPPLRLKKVIQEITVNQQKNLSENKNITSEVETSNYKVVSETVPVSESSSQGIHHYIFKIDETGNPVYNFNMWLQFYFPRFQFISVELSF